MIIQPIPRSARGFTAIEMSMVATVIAILALLILPMFGRQVDEARIAAAQSDIRTLGIAQQVANANTGKYFTLSSLENSDDIGADITDGVPSVTWNDSLSDAERQALALNWEGPYASFSELRTVTPDAVDPIFFRGGYTGLSTALGSNGPINQQTEGGLTISGTWATENIPVDPWGNPYLFYGPDYYHLTTRTAANGATETRHGNWMIVSFGPDGLPGAGQALSTNNLVREAGVIGTGDDEMRLF